MNMLASDAASSKRRCSSKLKPRRLRPLALHDDKAQQFTGWWQRMHRKRTGLIMIKLKPLVFVDAQTGRDARFVWEVCKWPRFGGFDWVFVCWMIDGVGMWSKTFPTKKAALSFFGSSPDVVMKPAKDDPARRGVKATATAPSP